MEFFSFIAPGQEWGGREGRQGENEKFFSRARSSLENTKKRVEKSSSFFVFPELVPVLLPAAHASRDGIQV